jgi:hypothetical protein
MKDKFPFREIVSSDHSVRVFPQTTKKTELKWHFDNEDREITFLHDSDWKFQMDDELPIDIHEGLKVFIPEGEYHRIIKGTGDLKVRVKKLNKTRLLPHTQKA